MRFKLGCVFGGSCASNVEGEGNQNTQAGGGRWCRKLHGHRKQLLFQIGSVLANPGFRIRCGLPNTFGSSVALRLSCGEVRVAVTASLAVRETGHEDPAHCPDALWLAPRKRCCKRGGATRRVGHVATPSCKTRNSKAACQVILAHFHPKKAGSPLRFFALLSIVSIWKPEGLDRRLVMGLIWCPVYRSGRLLEE